MTGPIIIAAIVGFVIGGILAWLIAVQRNAALVSEERLKRTVAETKLAEIEKNILEQRALLSDAETRWKETFENLSTKALTALQQGARTDLGERQKSIENLLKPLQETLGIYQQRLQQNESMQAQTMGQVKAQIESLINQNQSLSLETSQLRKVLSSNQTRGRWGEETLRRVVESAGMSAHCDFVEQTMQGDGKPDLVVRLPGDRVIVVDSKVPDLDFITALETSDETARKAAFESHAAKLKQTIKALADRNYPGQFQNALDYSVLFLPAESLFSAALEGDRDLIVWASSRRILLATPASLIALLRAVAVSWQQWAATENSQKIIEAGTLLYERVSKFVEHLNKVREGLEKANDSFDAAARSFESRVTPAAEKLKKLGVVRDDVPVPEIESLEAHARKISVGEDA